MFEKNMEESQFTIQNKSYYYEKIRNFLKVDEK